MAGPRHPHRACSRVVAVTGARRGALVFPTHLDEQPEPGSASDDKPLDRHVPVARGEDGERQPLTARPQHQLADVPLPALEFLQRAAAGEDEAFEVSEAIEDDLRNLAPVFDDIVAGLQQRNRGAVG